MKYIRCYHVVFFKQQDLRGNVVLCNNSIHDVIHLPPPMLLYLWKCRFTVITIWIRSFPIVAFHFFCPLNFKYLINVYCCYNALFFFYFLWAVIGISSWEFVNKNLHRIRIIYLHHLQWIFDCIKYQLFIKTNLTETYTLNKIIDSFGIIIMTKN